MTLHHFAHPPPRFTNCNQPTSTTTQNLSRSKSNDTNGSRSGSAGGGTVPAPPPKGGTVPSNPAYQGSLKSSKNGPSSASSSSNSISGSGASPAPSHAPYNNNAVYPAGQGTPSLPRLRPNTVNHLADKTPPAPPVVVVSSEMPVDPIPPLSRPLPPSPWPLIWCRTIFNTSLR